MDAIVPIAQACRPQGPGQLEISSNNQPVSVIIGRVWAFPHNGETTKFFYGEPFYALGQELSWQSGFW